MRYLDVKTMRSKARMGVRVLMLLLAIIIFPLFFVSHISSLIFLAFLPAALIWFSIESIFKNTRALNTWTVSRVLRVSGWLLMLFLAIPILPVFFVSHVSFLIFLVFTPAIFLLGVSGYIIFSERNRIIYDAPLKMDEVGAQEEERAALKPTQNLPSFLDETDRSRLSVDSKRRSRVEMMWITPILENYGLEIPEENKFVLDSEAISEQLKIFARLRRQQYFLTEVTEIISFPNFDLLNFARDYTSNDPALFQSALSEEEMGCLSDDDLMLCLKKAAAVGNFKFVMWLTSPDRGDRRVEPTSEILYWAACSGDVDLVRWLVDDSRDWQLSPDEATFKGALLSGNFVLSTWLKKGCERHDLDFFEDANYQLLAAYTGDLDIVNDISFPMVDDKLQGQKVFIFAAASGNVKLMKYMMEHLLIDGGGRASTSIDIFHIAANSGTELLMQMLIDIYRVRPDMRMLRAAARSGSLPMVQLLLKAEWGLSPDITILEDAAEGGGLDLVKWLISPERGDQQLSSTPSVLRYAVKEGHFSVVKWLLEREGGHLLIDNQTLEIARRLKNEKFLDLLKEVGRQNNESEVEEPNESEVEEQKERRGAPIVLHSAGNKKRDVKGSAALTVAVNRRGSNGPLHQDIDSQRRMTFLPDPLLGISDNSEGEGYDDGGGYSRVSQVEMSVF